MNDDTRAVAHALSNYAEHTNNGSTGSIETRLEFEHATAILRENDIRNQPGRHDPLREYETTLNATAHTFDDLPDRITVHLDAGYDSKNTREFLDEFGCDGQIASKGKPAPLQATRRWPVERTNCWHNRGFRKMAICTEVKTKVINARSSPSPTASSPPDASSAKPGPDTAEITDQPKNPDLSAQSLSRYPVTQL